jgi:hypothetical protein
MWERWRGGKEGKRERRGEGKREVERERNKERKMINFRKIQKSNEWNLSFLRTVTILAF